MKPELSSDPMNTYKLTTFGIVVFLTISSAFSQSPPQYSLLDLGPGDAFGINNKGQVVGRTVTDHVFAFLYSGGTMTDLGSFGGSNTVPNAINDMGQVVGFSTTRVEAPNPCDPNNPDYYGYDYCDPAQNPDAPDPNAPYYVDGRQYAFLYSGGAMINLGTLPGHDPEWDDSSANGINNSGQVVGYSTGVFDPFSGPPYRAFLYSSGSMTDIDTLSSDSSSQSAALGINNAGQVVGSVNNHAFLYSGGTMMDLGVQSPSIARAINDSGQIVGGGWGVHAFLYSGGGSIIDLNDGDLAGSTSQAIAINNAGQVVGWYRRPGSRPFLYTGGTAYDLLSLCTDCGTMQEVEATGINDSGQIVAYGTRPGLNNHAFLFRPIASLSAGVPVSSTVATNTSYTVVAPVTNSSTGSDHTNVALIGGTATNPATVNITFSSSAVAGFQAASDVVNISGTGSDTVVLQVSYNEAQAISVFGAEADARLMWLDPTDNQWKLAVAGNTGGTPQFINRAYRPATDFQLGNYGVDTTNNVVWAVINHNSFFAIGKPAVALTGTVQQPINRDGSSVFNAKRGVVPVKFTLTQNGNATCTLPTATIAVTRTAGGVVGAINESTYSSAADSGSNFRIDSCQYIYNLAASALGAGTYRVDIKINNQSVGTASFQLK
jgi:probable HAF family extracellular repeat protein